MQRNRLHWAGISPWSENSGSDDCRDHQHKQQQHHTSSGFRIATDHLTIRCDPVSEDVELSLLIYKNDSSLRAGCGLASGE